jgi:hypothetical protein
MPAVADVTIQLQNGGTETSQLLTDYLADSHVLSDFVELVDQNFDFDPPLVLAIGVTEGPDYNGQTHVLRMPYTYLDRAVEVQERLTERREDALQRGLDVFEYTLYHLLGHALNDDPGIEADAAAESLSSWVMLRHWSNGGEQWYAAISAFGAASQKLDGPLEDFWHAHSLYRSRQNTIECWILGSDPTAYERLLPAVLEPINRRRKCEASWRKLNQESVVKLEYKLLENAALRQH